MAEIKVRVNDETYDVLILGATTRETMAIREAFSAVDVNRAFAQANQGSLLEAARGNSVLADLHQEYKDTIRDVVAAGPTEVEEVFEEEEDEFEDFSS